MTQIRLYFLAEEAVAKKTAIELDRNFEEEGQTTALFEHEPEPTQWCWSVYCDDTNENASRNIISQILSDAGIEAEIRSEILQDKDWVAETLRDLAPVRAGRFFVHGSHDSHLAAQHRFPVQIDAGLAFGTGHHGTTAGCLDLLEIVLRRSQPKSALDVGTGSGVLAIALAKAARIPVLATDIDHVATYVAKQNARINKVATFVKTETAAGFDHPAFGKFGKADIVFANILARPLERLSHPLAQHVASGGSFILSGLLPHQKARIVSAYRRQGLLLEHAHIRENWLSLLMRKP